MEAGPSAQEGLGHVFPVGYVFDFPRAYLYVQHGIAEPADEECEKAARLSVEGRIIAQEAYQEMIERARKELRDDELDDTEHFSDPEYL
jgi:F0F1-type ATP synthase epsilon subunit